MSLPIRDRGDAYLKQQSTVLATVLAPLLTGASALALYLFTLPPTVVAGDGGELIASARVLGVPHPTGYPLYMLVARFFDLAPFANPAVRIALLSAVCGAGAAAAIAWVATTITGSVAAGLLAGALAAANGPMWMQATQAEVYAPNALIVALAMAAFVSWRLRPRPRAVVFLALLTGLGLSHHRTALFFTLPLLLAAAYHQRRSRLPVAKTALALFAPLLLYLYLPLRSAAQPAVMWSDLSTWDNFLRHVSGSAYYAYAFGRSPAEALHLLASVAGQVVSQFTIGGLVLAAVGLVTLFLRRRMFSLCLVISCTGLSLWNLGYHVPDIFDFFLPCGLALAIWSGEGLAAMGRWLQALPSLRGGRLPLVVTGIVLLAVPANLVMSNWSQANRRGYWRDYDSLRGLLAQVPRDGVYVTTRDDFITLYLQEVEGFRRDVDVVSPLDEQEKARRSITDARLLNALPALRDDFLGRASVFSTEEAKAQASLRFAVGIAEALDWQRPVYCGADLPSPPADLPVQALWWNLFRITQERTDVPVRSIAEPGAPPSAQFANGVSLVGASLTSSALRPRQLLGIEFEWSCGSPLERPLRLVVQLHPPSGRVESPGMLLRYGTWLAYGAAPLAPTPPGLVYRQRLAVIVPTNAPEGTWSISVGVAEDLAGEVELRSIGEFRVARATG